MPNPWGKTVTLTAASTAYSLLTLMQALDANVVKVAAHLRIFFGLGGGAAKLYIGNSDVSTTNYGSALVAGQVYELGPFLSNSIDLSSIFLLSDTPSVAVGVSQAVR